MSAVRKYALLAACLSLAAARLYADDSGKSQTAAAYLWIAPTARVQGMGSAFAAIADDASAIYYNPSGLAKNSGHEFVLSSSLLGMGRVYNFIGYKYAFSRARSYGNKLGWSMQSFNARGGRGGEGFFRKMDAPSYGFGLGLINFGVADIDGYDSYGNKLAGFSDNEYTVILGFGTNFYENICMGGSLKFHRHDAQSASASGIGLDLGVLYANPKRPFSYGLSLKNIIGSLAWKVPDSDISYSYEYTEPISTNLRLGTAYTGWKQWLCAFDLDYTARQKMEWHLGGEYQYSKNMWLRAGLDTLNPTLGFGLSIKKPSYEISAGYAFVFDMDQLYNQHKFDISGKFGSSGSKSKRKRNPFLD